MNDSRQMKESILSVFLSLILAMLLCGCAGQDTAQTQTESQADDKPLIGMSFDSFLIERWETDRDYFVDAASEQGVSVNVQNANGDVETQLSQIRYLISKPVDVLVVIGIDADSLTDVIDEAKAAGIPVIAYDRMIRNGNADLYISFDNEKVGRLMAEALVREGLENKKVLMLNGPTEDNNVLLISEGFRSVMNENGVKVVEEFNAPGWKPESAAEYMNNHPEILEQIDAIMCGNDNIATSVSRVLAEMRMAGKVKIVGQDADLEACQRIVQGTQVMTVYKPVEKMAEAAAQYACRLAKGGNLDNVKQTINDGTNDIPYVVLDPIAVDKDNIDDTIIAAGFHLEEDVYLYVPGHDK